MRSHDLRKPIGKCKGCPLNLKKRCGLFDHPREKWAKGKCNGYMNEQLYAQYLEQQAEPPKRTLKEIRQEKAAQRNTEPHYDGKSDPGRSRH